MVCMVCVCVCVCVCVSMCVYVCVLYRIADELMKQDHPIWPNRSRQIIQSLVENQWHRDHWPASKKN